MKDISQANSKGLSDHGILGLSQNDSDVRNLTTLSPLIAQDKEQEGSVLHGEKILSVGLEV